MNRRNFLRSMLGVAAATALPSEVFPFRKIFLPENPKPIDPYTWAGLARSPYPGRLSTPGECVLRQYLDANLKPSNLIHAPATPDNIMEFIDGLEEDFS